MRVLGIETSCDETAAAVVEIITSTDQQPTNVGAMQSCRLLSNVVASSMDLHAQYGGVVPEIAARSHIESIIPVINQALEDAKCDWSNIDAIAVTQGAGLGGSLLIGVLTARTLAIALAKPLYAINHVEGHVYANFLTSAGSLLPASERSSELRNSSLADAALGTALLRRGSNSTASSATPPRLASAQSPTDVKQWQLNGESYTLRAEPPKFPMLAIIVSGGHSQLVFFRDHFDYTLLGQTQDDAIGEAFDKVAKIIGLPYPGGPSVSKKAQEGDPLAYTLPKAKIKGHTRLHHSDEVQGNGEQRKAAYKEVRQLSSAADDAAIRAVVESGKYSFSFSGLKTAVLRLAQKEIGEDYSFPSSSLPDRLSDAQKANIAASFQRIAIETIVDKAVLAYEEFTPASIVIAGGVAANQELRRQLDDRLPIGIEYPDIKLCTDNGAMIATLGCFKMLHDQPIANPYNLEIQPNLSM